jgi:hypothetical protein
VIAAILPKMGIVRNAARKVVFGTAKYGGLGLDHLATIQNYSRLQYLIGHRPLTRDERLNIEADIQADVIRAQARGTIAAHPNCPHWDIEAASLFIQGSKVTSGMKNQLTSQMHDDNLRYFLMQKESWSSQIFDAIDWNSSERALRRLSKNRPMNVVKLCHKYWHTGSRHVRFYG